jgi:hypothetical protein
MRLSAPGQVKPKQIRPKQIRGLNQVTTEEVLAARPNLGQSVGTSKANRPARGLRKAIRKAKPEITKERKLAELNLHRQVLGRRAAQEARAENQRAAQEARDARDRALEAARMRDERASSTLWRSSLGFN